MWDGWEKDGGSHFYVLDVFNPYHKPSLDSNSHAAHLYCKCSNQIVSYNELGAWSCLSETEQEISKRTIGSFLTSSPPLSSASFIYLALYLPIFPIRIHSLATCSLSYIISSFPLVVLCYRNSHCATSYIHSFMPYCLPLRLASMSMMRGRTVGIRHHFLPPVAL